MGLDMRILHPGEKMRDGEAVEVSSNNSGTFLLDPGFVVARQVVAHEEAPYFDNVIEGRPTQCASFTFCCLSSAQSLTNQVQPRGKNVSHDTPS